MSIYLINKIDEIIYLIMSFYSNNG